MKTVGLLGGMSWESTADYYKAINEGIKHKLGGLHDVIYNELCLGNIESKSKTEYLRIIDELSQNGAEAVILGCTEISMLVNQTDTAIALYDTTQIHANRAVDEMI